MRLPGIAIGMLLPVIWANPIYAQSTTLQDDLVTLVAESNRANREAIRSLDLKFQIDIQNLSGDDVGTYRKMGRYAMDAGLVYMLDDVNGKGAMTYVRNGDRARTYHTSGRAVFVGKATNKRLTPGASTPWEYVDLGLGGCLDRLGPDDGQITGAHRESKDGKDYIVVDMTKKVPLADGGQATGAVSVWYSREANYLADKYTAVYKNDAGNFVGSWEASDVQFFKTKVGDRWLYLPLTALKTDLDANRAVRGTIKYSIDAASVKVNPSLPDDLFQIPIKEGDAVIDVDYDMNLNNHFGKTFMGIEETATQPAGTPEAASKAVEGRGLGTTDTASAARSIEQKGVAAGGVGVWVWWCSPLLVGLPLVFRQL